ncbi:MAG: phenylalanine--tRNA ligase subunit alpha [Oscillospiraceae bacterium]|jgi:phenylalanyl-tRNA synthetase alpha chain|nr:phenylalanine--tRNA ligase subunit alpha [Oscillospiraceae bacterium]
MQEKINNILNEGTNKIKKAKTIEELKIIKSSLLGKQGVIKDILKEIPNLEISKRSEAGCAANKLKNCFNNLLKLRKEELFFKMLEIPLDFDATLPGIPPHTGGLHPITQICYDLNDTFRSMGFEIFQEQEITSELYAFDNLNFPKNHPARESMDTYWLTEHSAQKNNSRLCLRPHLTGASIRYLQTHKPPFRFVYPGKVYRNESTDAKHERAFFQYEALIVDHDFTFSSGKIIIKSILSKVFGCDVSIRMRVGYFPFVEPGFEIDMGCLVCNKKGCRVCKYVGWIEIMPGGTPHPNVLRSAKLNPEKFTGFYVNIGLDRLVMMRYGIDDIRLFHSADLRFLKQFN